MKHAPHPIGPWVYALMAVIVAVEAFKYIYLIVRSIRARAHGSKRDDD